MSTDTVGGRLDHARNGNAQARAQVTPAPPAAAGEPLDFVRFCYGRRRVSWPALYDEMCAVAARGAFRGLGYAELAERGISFSLGDLPRLAAMTELVMGEERNSAERRNGLEGLPPEHVTSLTVARATG